MFFFLTYIVFIFPGQAFLHFNNIYLCSWHFLNTCLMIHVVHLYIYVKDWFNCLNRWHGIPLLFLYSTPGASLQQDVGVGGVNGMTYLTLQWCDRGRG